VWSELINEIDIEDLPAILAPLLSQPGLAAFDFAYRRQAGFSFVR
jgi:hypothetical protein